VADIPFPNRQRRSRWHIGWRARDIAVTRARTSLLAAMLFALGWSAALGVIKAVETSHNCNTKLGKAADRVVSFVLHRSSQCKAQRPDSLPLGIP
jgi:hypothetical protein